VSRPQNPYHAGRRHDEWARGYQTNTGGSSSKRARHSHRLPGGTLG
jgi:hypothetical protein